MFQMFGLPREQDIGRGKRARSGSSSQQGNRPADFQLGQRQQQAEPLNKYKRRIGYFRQQQNTHGRIQRLSEWPTLQFTQGSKEAQKLAKLGRMEILPFKTINWDVIDELGERARLEGYLRNGWKEVLIDEPQFVELTIEFWSTF